ncbi:MAG: butyrate kinase [Bacteroidales bacterium]|nr:MAG: butyrate kinase [Bacteroidales bacterium]
MEVYRILVINPGSTSTKVGVYRNTESRLLKSIKHSPEELAPFEKVVDQFKFRKEIIMNELVKAEVKINEITAVIGRGGLVKPIKSGVYEVNDRLKEDLRKGILGEHASNLGGLLADEIARCLPDARAFIADPVVVDELQTVARVAGHPKFRRISIFHALNHKAVARAYAKFLDKEYEEMSLIVAHLGGGITIAAHKNGRVIDVNQGLDGEGPFSPERSGTLPVGDLAKLCFGGKYSYEEVKKMITGHGGYMAYFETNDAYAVERMAEMGDRKAQLIQEAMAYQVGKEIGAMSAVLKGNVDAIILTGGIAYNSWMVDYIKTMVAHIARIVVHPGEDEMKTLALNALHVMRGDMKCEIYK